MKKEAVIKKPFCLIKISLISVFVFGLGMILRQRMLDVQNARSCAEAEQIAGLWEADEDILAESEAGIDPETFKEDQEEPLPAEAASLTTIRLDVLQKINGDVIGWIKIPGTEVSYPVMKGEDNQYYLSHDWQQAENKAGSIFLESQCDPAMTDFHTIIYGHRMSNETMFGTLKYYKDLAYWQEHPSVYLATDSGIYRYDIFSAWEAGLKDMVYQLDLTGREEEFIQLCLENSVIKTGIVPDAQDRILTMSTCTGSGHSKRWTVQGYLAQIYTNYLSENETETG